MLTMNEKACRPLLMAWSLEALGNSALVTIYPFFIRYVVISDGAQAEKNHQSIDAQVGSICAKCTQRVTANQ